jgi:hypothetical protein
VINLNNLISSSKNIVDSQQNSGLPLNAVKFIRSHPLISKLNFYNSYGWGGYLDFVYPEKLWFIDGRMSNWRCSEIKDSSILEDALQIEQVGADFNKVINSYNIQAILIGKSAILSNALSISSI